MLHQHLSFRPANTRPLACICSVYTDTCIYILWYIYSLLIHTSAPLE